MKALEKTKLAENMFYWKATEEPLSADVAVIQGNRYVWIFDVGNREDVANTLNSLPGEKNLILSHFHSDHMGNISKVSYHNLYQGSHTYRYNHTGEIVTEDIYIEDGVKLHLFPLPSTHAKGSIALEVDDTYAFLGDGTYRAMLKGRPGFNAQLLFEEIKVLKSLKAEYVMLSHDEEYIHEKNNIINKLEDIYSLREKGNPYIWIT